MLKKIGPAGAKETRKISSRKSPAISAGIIQPPDFFCRWDLPKLKPFFRNWMPINIPQINPAIPIMALPSPPARRKSARQGQPRKTRAPIMAKTPRKKRRSGEEPPRGLYSPARRAAAKAPRTNPIISGRRYWTTSARCNPSAPAISRAKHATQMPILGGFPKY